MKSVPIVWDLIPFSTITAASSPTRVFLSFLTPVLHTTYYPTSWLLFRIDCKSIGKRRVMFVAWAFVKRWKEC